MLSAKWSWNVQNLNSTPVTARRVQSLPRRLLVQEYLGMRLEGEERSNWTRGITECRYLTWCKSSQEPELVCGRVNSVEHTRSAPSTQFSEWLWTWEVVHPQRLECGFRSVISWLQTVGWQSIQISSKSYRYHQGTWHSEMAWDTWHHSEVI